MTAKLELTEKDEAKSAMVRYGLVKTIVPEDYTFAITQKNWRTWPSLLLKDLAQFGVIKAGPFANLSVKEEYYGLNLAGRAALCHWWSGKAYWRPWGAALLIGVYFRWTEARTQESLDKEAALVALAEALEED